MNPRNNGVIEEATVIHPYPVCKSVETIIDSYNDGLNCVYAVGESAFDEFEVAPSGEITKRMDILEDELLKKGLKLVRYSLATGTVYEYDNLSASEKRHLESMLSACGLTTQQEMFDETEFAQKLRGIFSLINTRNDYRFDNEKKLKIALLVEFSHHLIPSDGNYNHMMPTQKVIVELINKISSSMSLRQSGHFIIFNGKDCLPSDLSNIQKVNIPFPNAQEKELFATKALDLYKNATLEKGVSPSIIANLTVSTGNNGLERLIRKSHRKRTVLTSKAISKQREAEIISNSEGTLAVLPTERVKGVKLVGLNVMKPMKILLNEANNIKLSNSNSISNIILVGSPGVAKTDMVAITALQSGLPAYSLISPKGSLVGETERLSRLQNRILKSHKNISFSDEFSKAMPTGRQTNNLDSGASDAVVAAMQEYLSDGSRTGNQGFFATSNTIWQINDALLRRFEVVPVLMPLEEDYPTIISTIANKIFPHLNVTEKDTWVNQASQIYYSKFASPRHIVKTLKILGSYQKNVSAKDLVNAANQLNTQNNRVNTIYTELSAIQSCTYNGFLPWWDVKNYRFPAHIDKVIDKHTGEVNHRKVTAEMKALEPYINI